MSALFGAFRPRLRARGALRGRHGRLVAAALLGTGLALSSALAHAQAPIGQPAATKPAQPFPTSTPAAPQPGGQLQPPVAPTQPQPGQPPATGQPALPAPPPTWTPAPTWTPVPTWTPLPTFTPTVTRTPTPTPYPTFVPRATPTLAWPTPAPGAFFRSRYLANQLDPSLANPSAGSLRGRIVDWRGIGLNGWRVHAVSELIQTETASAADGQYSFTGLPPGSYEVTLPDYPGEPARDIPILAGRVTTLDWIETSRNPIAPAPVLSPSPTLAPAPPTSTATAVPAALIQRPASSPARPSPPEVALLRIFQTAVEQFINAFLTGVAIVTVVAVVTIGLVRWRR